MNDVLGLAQLPHPKGGPKLRRKSVVVPWNTDKHKRKFMKCKGEYVSNSALKTDTLMFWGEWEPQSKIIKRFNNSDGDLPKYLQEPIWPCPAPNGNVPSYICGGCSYQNTDPYIFDPNGFIYSNCRQLRNGVATQMAHLQIGSLILFGSVLLDNNGLQYFGIDTVFVIKDFVTYSQGNYQQVKTFINNHDFFTITPLQKLTLGNATLRCYRGATFSNKENDMYSFVPCQVCKGNLSQGFERLKLTINDLRRIEQLIGCNNLIHFNSRVHHTQSLTAYNVKKVWTELKKLNEKQGLLEGVRFYI